MKFKTSESILGNGLTFITSFHLGIGIFYTSINLFGMYLYQEPFRLNTFLGMWILVLITLIWNAYMRVRPRRVFFIGDIEISYWGVTVTYHKKQIFHVPWESIQEIGIIIVNKFSKNTYVYFSTKPIQMTNGKGKQKIPQKQITADFSYCSVLWDLRIPDILQQIPSYKKILYLNGSFQKEGKKWLHVF